MKIELCELENFLNQKINEVATGKYKKKKKSKIKEFIAYLIAYVLFFAVTFNLLVLGVISLLRLF